MNMSLTHKLTVQYFQQLQSGQHRETGNKDTSTLTYKWAIF